MTATESLGSQQVILVDDQDNSIGTAEKLAAHEQNLLHRAFSVFIFREKPQLELLLQQRALNKYHSAGLWTNTCCSHPNPGENTVSAGQRRLQEEMGIICSLAALGRFHYIAHFPNGLSENEMDHVLFGTVPSTVAIHPDPHEVHAYRWITVSALEQEMRENPQDFTPWLAKALALVKPFLVTSITPR